MTLTRTGAAAASPQPEVNNCPKAATSGEWGPCFDYVAASATLAPSVPPSGAPAVYLAVPADASHFHLTSTTLTGTPVAGQDALYSSITVGYADNTSKIIAGAGTGASTGFGIAGPYGAAVGFVLGGFAATRVGAYPGEVEPKRPTLQDYLCKDVDVDFGRAGAVLAQPFVSLPVTLRPDAGRPFASTAQVQGTDYVPALCWHALPNAAEIGRVRLAPVNAMPFDLEHPGLHAAAQGDGWLYRFVEAGDPNAPPPGAVTAADYFRAAGPRHDFPYSACRKVALQITWWEELAAAVDRISPGEDPKPRAVSFGTVVADPAFVNVADVRKGGVITFKPDCGAYVSQSVDTSYGASINAAVSATQTIVAAEQAWKSGQTTSAAAPR